MPWVTQYGYLGLFAALVLGIVGLPVPDETLLTFAGYLVFRRQLDLPLTLLSGFCGSICGISISYGLGRSLGLFLIHKYGRFFSITEGQLARVAAWFEKRGKWTLPIGYFIPGVRHLTAYVAGASKLRYQVFAPFAYLGGCIWVLTFVCLGYFLGEGWEKVPDEIEQTLLYIVGGLALMALIIIVIRKVRRKKRALEV